MVKLFFDNVWPGAVSLHFPMLAAVLFGIAVAAAGTLGDLIESVLKRDAEDSLAAVRMVAAQPAIGSQMIDNLNATIHLRALLTDVFLIDEILNPRVPGGAKPPAG